MKALILALCLLPMCANAADYKTYQLTLWHHAFFPALLELPRDERVHLIFHNKDTEVEDFISHDLKREKRIAPNGSIRLTVGPLHAGSYTYFGNQHAATAHGTFIVK